MESYGSFHVRIPDNGGGGGSSLEIGRLKTDLNRLGKATVERYDATLNEDEDGLDLVETDLEEDVYDVGFLAEYESPLPGYADDELGTGALIAYFTLGSFNIYLRTACEGS